ncbi:MAG: sugar ABC transporter permease [Anaerolineaceae bacterium]|nr:sugar ABC transporter permease [Anaerolineaceae bacterium]
MQKKIAKRIQNSLPVFLFIGPSALALIIVMVYPSISAVMLSLKDFVNKELTYVGFANYPAAFLDSTTWSSLWITTKFTFFSVSLSLILGLFLALVLNKQTWGRKFFRTAFMLPWPMLNVVVAILFSWMFNAQYGIVNEIFVKLGLLNQYKSWFTDGQTALLLVELAVAWKEAPFFMLMILAAMQSIPQDQYEAAAVDGATGWQELIYITLPNLRYIILITTILQIIWQFRVYDFVAIMTNGGPNKATEVLSVLVFKNSFEFFRFGKGAAIAVLMTVVILLFTIAYLWILRKRETDFV